MRRPRLAGLLAGGAGLLAAAGLLVAADPAAARGGSGSFGFRGGGGGFHGFSGFHGFGRTHFFFFGGGGGGSLLILIVVVIIVLFLLLYVLPRVVKFWRQMEARGPAARRKVASRTRRVQLAAAEASEDDALFAPDVVIPEARQLFVDVQRAWDTNDRVRLRSLVAPDLLVEWERRLDDFEAKGLRNRVQILGEPRIEYVGLRNVADDSGDRVTVRIEARLRDYVETRYGEHRHSADEFSDTTKVREFWTLGKSGGGRWVLLSIEQGAEGSHALDEEIIASPWADERTMRDEALVEGAIAEAAPNVAEVADLQFDGTAQAAANDLSVADGRFAPQVLEVAARRAVQAWAEAVDGADAALEQIARADAVRDLLYPSTNARLVVRGPQVRQIRIVALDAAAQPPTMTIEVDLSGRRYVEDRDTAQPLSGGASRAINFTERWTLALDGDDTNPWRIATVGAPAGRA
jgi:predicted lipid-binding transport protein (Tim44 family)